MSSYLNRRSCLQYFIKPNEYLINEPMHKYSGKTYSKTRKRESKSSTIFDDVQTAEGSDESTESSKTPFGSSLPKKSSWSRVHKAVAHTQENSPTKNVSKGAKRSKKLDTIDEHDPFAFSDDDIIIESTVLRSSQVQSQKSVDPSDKSTDDEAYSSSQELSETSSKSTQQNSKRTSGQNSPFKRFLVNNDKSLSPMKNKNFRRLSALPTNTNASDDEVSESSEPDIISLTRSSSWPQNNKKVEQEGAIKVKRSDKPLFTVIRNVKKMSECLESGEDQEFFDDIEYLLDGISPTKKLPTRCLSSLDIASRCTSASFRINLRAHGFIPKIFKLLNDASTDQNLALCTSAIMFVLTQDKQNIDFDKFVLEMMMKFLSVSDVEDTVEINHKQYVEKARSMFEKHMSRIPGAYLDLKDISASSLARESLLSITTERTGAWFKEEIRTLGGLDHIVNAVTECVDWLIQVHGNYISKDQNSQAKLQRINKSLKLLENITYENDVNQAYLIRYQNGIIARDLARFIKLCISTITEGTDAESSSTASCYIHNEATLDVCMLNTLKVFLNLSHDCDKGSILIGQQLNLLSSLLFCVLQLPQHLEASKRFDLHVLGLGLLINLVEHSKQNIATLVQLRTDPCHESQNTSMDSSMVGADGLIGSVEALMQLFIVRERSARDTDKMTDALSPEDEEEDDDVLKPTKDGLGWICGKDIDVSVDETAKNVPDEDETAPSSSSPNQLDKKNNKENLEDEIGKALVIANQHMEDSMVASYVALLLGCIVQDNKANEVLVRSLLPDNDFALLIDVLKKFLGFMRLTSGTSGQAIERILKVLQKCSEKAE